jgi:hypothetical protein
VCDQLQQRKLCDQLLEHQQRAAEQKAILSRLLLAIRDVQTGGEEDPSARRKDSMLASLLQALRNGTSDASDDDSRVVLDALVAHQVLQQCAPSHPAVLLSSCAMSYPLLWASLTILIHHTSTVWTISSAIFVNHNSTVWTISSAIDVPTEHPDFHTPVLQCCCALFVLQCGKLGLGAA